MHAEAIPTVRAPSRVALVGGSGGPGTVSLWDTYSDEEGNPVTALTGSVGRFAESMGIKKVMLNRVHHFLNQPTIQRQLRHTQHNQFSIIFS